MNYLIIPKDTYTVTASNYMAYSVNYNTIITIPSEENTSEYFINKLITSYNLLNPTEIISVTNNNFISFKYYGANSQYVFMSTSESVFTDVNNWMYPLTQNYKFMQSINYPVTKTISIIINSNTLPIYNIPNDININIDIVGQKQILTIPKGNHSVSSVNNIFRDKCNEFQYEGDISHEYLNIPYFNYTRLFPQATSSFVVYDNEDFNKYYGLLHMIYTFPSSFTIDTTGNTYKFLTNMAPTYRSIHIPEMLCTTDHLVNYINTHNTDKYTNGRQESLEYTMFNAKVVNDDIVIYTTDGTEFFINPICHLNTYKETNYASEHRLCPVTKGIVYNIKKIYYTSDKVNIVPDILGDFTNFSATGLPDGLSFDPVSGTITGVISNNNTSGLYPVVITSSSFTGSFTINFNIRKKTRVMVADNKKYYQ